MDEAVSTEDSLMEDDFVKMISPVQEILVQSVIRHAVNRISSICCNRGDETVDHKYYNTAEDILDKITFFSTRCLT